MKYEHRRLLAMGMAVGAATLFPLVAPGAAGVTAVAAVGAGVQALGGLASNCLAALVDRRLDEAEADPTRPDVNHDLERVVARGLANVVAAWARQATVEAGARRAVERLARALPDVAPEVFSSAAEFPDILPVHTSALLEAAAASGALPATGTVEGWRSFLVHAALRADVALDEWTLGELAAWLHVRAWEGIRGALKADFAGDGKGYAALQLEVFGELLRAVHAALRELASVGGDSRATRADLERLREDVAELVTRARAAPVTASPVVGVDPERWHASVERLVAAADALGRDQARLVEDLARHLAPELASRLAPELAHLLAPELAARVVPAVASGVTAAVSGVLSDEVGRAAREGVVAGLAGREDAGRAAAKAAEDERLRRYGEELLRRLGRVPLPDPSPRSRRLDLGGDEALVPLPLRVVAVDGGPVEAGPDRQSAVTAPVSPWASADRGVSDRLLAGRQVLLTGAPGSGKSTLLAGVARSLAEAGAPPVVLLGRSVGGERGGLGPLVRAQLRAWSWPEDEARAVEALLVARVRTGEAAVLVDALDEVAQPEARLQVVQTLEELWAGDRVPAVFVTSRPATAPERTMRAFDRLEVAPLDQRARKAMVLRLAGRYGLPPDGPDVRRLVDLVADGTTLGTMGTSVLTLLLAARVLLAEQAGRPELTPRRGDLFRRVVELLLGPRGDGRALAWADVVPRLAALALLLTRAGVEEGAPARVHPELRRLGVADPAAWLVEVARGTGLLTPGEEGEDDETGAPAPAWSFFHPSFREYLAALAVVQGGEQVEERVIELAWSLDRGWGEVLGAPAGTPGEQMLVGRWREPFVLAVGLLDRRKDGSAARVLRRFVEALGPEGGHPATRALSRSLGLSDPPARPGAVLALEALAEAPDVDPETAGLVLAFAAHQVARCDAAWATSASTLDRALARLAVGARREAARDAALRAFVELRGDARLSAGLAHARLRPAASVSAALDEVERAVGAADVRRAAGAWLQVGQQAFRSHLVDARWVSPSFHPDEVARAAALLEAGLVVEPARAAGVWALSWLLGCRRDDGWRVVELSSGLRARLWAVIADPEEDPPTRRTALVLWAPEPPVALHRREDWVMGWAKVADGVAPAPPAPEPGPPHAASVEADLQALRALAGTARDRTVAATAARLAGRWGILPAALGRVLLQGLVIDPRADRGVRSEALVYAVLSGGAEVDLLWGVADDWLPGDWIGSQAALALLATALPPTMAELHENPPGELRPLDVERAWAVRWPGETPPWAAAASDGE